MSFSVADSQAPLKSDVDDHTTNEVKIDDVDVKTSDDTKSDDDESIFNQAKFKALKQFSKLIAPLYITFALASLVCLIMGALNVANLGIIWGLIIIALSVVGSGLGSWGVFKFGTIEMEIDRFKQENNKYQTEIDEMKDTRLQLTGTVQSMQKTINQTEDEAKNLEESLNEFEELRKSLEDVAKDNQDIYNLVTNLNTMADDMKNAAIASRKAALLEAYYDYDNRDGQPGLSVMEFKRVLNKLDKETQRKFENLQVDLDGDGIIDLKEYQKAVDIILGDMDIDDISNNE
eukprot:CAMPEP_0114677148 /NCGR_PEP_ID=MMETSP0191-20121206/50150_1 /TAXON_ID=126664 /ORGANISM="Sorites sp." /LENGTH=288 /DNA_ID=CAMNT_0001949265 /DNA_START=43 /DNA_END=909 /DNA_ORIENTATION=+